METTPVKTDEQLRAEWIHRPQELRQLGFEEWRVDQLLAAAGRTSTASVLDSIQRIATGAEIVAESRERHDAGKMNKLEAKYAAHLELRKTAGEIVDWRFEPMKLRLAPRTYFDIDFIVVRRFRVTGTSFDLVELHEVKGHWEDDARVKVKIAATMFPWWKFRGAQWDKGTKDWKFEEFKP